MRCPGQAERGENQPGRNEDKQLASRQDGDQAGGQVRPADQAENTPPVRGEALDDAVVLTAIDDGEDDQDHGARRPQGPRRPGRPRLGPAIPYKDETGAAEDIPGNAGQARRSGIDRLAIDQEDAHDQQGEGAQQDMAEELRRRVAAGTAAGDGEGQGHAGDEQEGWEDGIGQAQAIDAAADMFEPGRDVVQGPQVVDEDHQHHGHGAQQVDCCDACRQVRGRGGGRMCVHGPGVTENTPAVTWRCEQELGYVVRRSELAPRTGLEPVTFRLTVECSTN